MRICIKNRKNCFTLFAVFGILLFSCGKKYNYCRKSCCGGDDEKNEKTVEPNFNIHRFKSQLDTLLSIVERKDFQFQLNIDTINENTNPEILWHFGQRGLFKIIRSEETSKLILYHFFDPKTSKILRIYVIEAHYDNPTFFERTHQTFLEEKDRQKLFMIDDEGNEYYINYRLTWLNDYVIILENKIYWLNVSTQYSKRSLNTIIDFFKDNLNERNYVDTIKVTHD